MPVGFNKEKNLEKAEELIRKLSKEGANIIVLPEMFNTPYSTKYFKQYGEHRETSDTLRRLQIIAREETVYIFAGSIPELDHEDRVYNTCFIIDNKGHILGAHRKMHLFDIDVKGGITFRESAVLHPGDQVTVVDTEYGKIGVGICYDIRFPELARLMTLEGAHIYILPGAFNMTTGPSHWEPLLRVRAIDNQMYVVATAPARDNNGVYTSYGNSMIVDPWGQVVNKLDEKEGILITEIDLTKIKKVRHELPLLKNRRKDIYEVVKVDKK